MQTINQTLQILLARFNGQVLIPFSAASELIGMADQTARNRLAAGTYPVTTILTGSRRFVHIADLADYVESLRSRVANPRRGRPTKASRMAGGAA